MIRGCVNILAAFTSLFVSLLALIILIFVSIKLTDISFNGLNYVRCRMSVIHGNDCMYWGSRARLEALTYRSSDPPGL